MESIMIKTFHLIRISLFIILLSGCQVFNFDRGNADKPPASIKKSLTDIDWNDVFSPLIADMLKAPQPANVNTLLISDINNNTGQYIAKGNINKAIFSELNKQSQYTVIDKGSVHAGKQALGLSFDDTLILRSKMIALGRYLGTDLVLFISIDELANQLDIPIKVTMELLSTKTGEIFWRNSNDQLFIYRNEVTNNLKSPAA